MKKLFRILGISIASFITIILLITATTKIFEDDIAKAILKKVSKEISAPIKVESVNFNLIRKFPLSTIEFNNLWLKDSNKKDTIAGIEHLYLSVNTREIIRGNYLVKKIVIDGFKSNYDINNDSISNIDFLLALLPNNNETEDEKPNDSLHLRMSLENLLLKNINCSYYDASQHIGAKVSIPEIYLKGNILNHDYTAKSRGNITITDVCFDDFNLELMQKAILDFNIDYKGDSAMINHFKFKTNGIQFDVSGWANIKDNINLNTAINDAQFDIGILSSYLPDTMLREFGIISAKGKLSLNGEINGIYNDSTLPKVDANFDFYDGAITTTEYPEIKQLTFSGDATNGFLQNNSTTSINFSSLYAKTPKSQLELQADLTNLDQPIYNVYSKGNVNLSEFKPFIPQDIVKNINGTIKWELGTKGQMPLIIDSTYIEYILNKSWANMAFINMDANLNDTLMVNDLNASLTYKPGNIALKEIEAIVPTYDIKIHNSNTDIDYNGSINDIDNMAVNVNTFHLEFDSSYVDMQASLSNLTNPNYDFKGEIKINLDDATPFIPDSLVKSMSGIFSGKINSAGYIHLDSIETQAMSLAFENTELYLNSKDVKVSLVDTLIEVSNLNMDFSMTPDTIFVKNFSGDYKGLDFAIKNTELINTYQSILLNQDDTLKVTTHLEIGDVYYPILEPFILQSDSSTAQDSMLTDSIELEPTNYHLDIKGSIAVKSFNLSNYEVDSSMTIKNFQVEDMYTMFLVTDSMYIADSLTFNAFGGYAQTSARYDIKPDKCVITLKNHIDGLDFKQILYNMDNFGQKDLTYENISGELTSDIDAEVVMLGDSIPMERMRFKGDFTLKNGAIINFEPAMQISKFTGMKELDNIQFQTLNTNLFVLNGAAYVPKTDIVSTALDASILGYQSLVQDDYRYHIEMYLGDVLTGKNPELMKKQAKAAKDEGDEVSRNGLNLRLESRKAMPVFDSKNARTNTKNKVFIQNNLLKLNFYYQDQNYNTGVE